MGLYHYLTMVLLLLILLEQWANQCFVFGYPIGFIVVIFIIVNDEIVKLHKEIDELKKQLNK